jgi:hypothetical protein
VLIVTAQNIFTDGQDKADYDVIVRINTRILWTGPVLLHDRKRGAAELLRKIAEEMEAEGWPGKPKSE